MTGDTHYDLETLAELAEGLLDDATARQVRDHLVICDPCGEALADLAGVREVLAAMPVPAMPLGVAMRVDQALAAEAERRRDGALRLDEAPDWDRIMRDAPWETGMPWDDEPAAPIEQAPADTPSFDTPRLVPLTSASPAAVNGVNGAAINGSSVNGSSGSSDSTKLNGSPFSVTPLVASAHSADAASDIESDGKSDNDNQPGDSSSIEDDEPARTSLGVVAEDGTVVPARRRRPTGRRRWLVPLSSAVAAAAVVIGGASVASNLLIADGQGPANRSESVALPKPKQDMLADVPSGKEGGSRFPVGETGYNYLDAELKGPLVEYFGSMPSWGSEAGDAKLNRCISKLSKLAKSEPIGIDRAYYNGNEAMIALFWHNKKQNSVQVRVVDYECKNLRKPALASWN
ncbi:hypothetical protein AB0K60_25040 [Thermopolyspora sp. NPDC052614]|uniref:anti-sigma factor family protein n=1 Tax=Thermopolyspora sp. NPDC052614 TaxID=3155682 RepID=UPI00342B52BA